MNKKAREQEPDAWPEKERNPLHEVETGTTLFPEKRDPVVAVSTHAPERAAKVVRDDTDEPLCVKELPIDMRGAWRSAYYYNCWWVVGHHLMYPCNSERDADRVLRRLQEEWGET